VVVRPQDLKIDYYKASGAGGQYVNKRMSAIRLTHIPSGMVVTSQTERSLMQNKESALSLLRARLLERNEKALEEKIGGARKSQIGTASREEKIRTYNFPQDRITDHRINKNFHGIEKIMDGKMEKIAEAMKKAGA
jgi:peptide chain release factor 1